MNKKPNLYVDADYYIYIGCYISSETRYKVQDKSFKLLKEVKKYCDDQELEYSEISKEVHDLGSELGKLAINAMFKSLLKKFNPGKFQVWLSPRKNYRNFIDPEYKAHRPKDKPLHHQEMKKYIFEKWSAKASTYMEADDAVSILHYRDYKNDPESSCIVTIDKDLKTTPGWHFCPRKKVLEFIEDFDAFHFFCTQMLTGDTVDNIKGIPKLGASAALTLLELADTKQDLLEVVITEYKRFYKDEWEEPFYRNGDLLWILREPDGFRGYLNEGS